MKNRRARSSKPSRGKLLSDARVYLSGPMDFVASRAVEKATGWRHRVGDFLRHLGVTVFDPWEKPDARGLHEYGREGEGTTDIRSKWSYAPGRAGAKAREEVASTFWPALHIDLRMVDTSDFLVCYCPTNIYSVGTPHEIVLARTQRKPVLFVSPPVKFKTLALFERHLKDNEDKKGLEYLEKLRQELPIKENANGAPSMWYTPLIGAEHFFDGFGFEPYMTEFKWKGIPLDEHEREHRPSRPLLPFLEQLSTKLPLKWDRHKDAFGPNDDWILWDIQRLKRGGRASGER